MAEYRHIEVSKDGIVYVARILEARLVNDMVIEGIAREWYDLAAQDDCRSLLVNFSGVGSISSSLLGKLIALNKRMKAKGGRLRLCELKPEILELFALTNTDLVLDCSSGDRLLSEAETSPSVEPLAPSQFSEAAAVLGWAFCDDPALMSMLHGLKLEMRVHKLTVVCRELLAACARRNEPLGIVSKGKVSAVAIVHRPGGYPLPLRWQLAILVRVVARLGPRGLGRFIHWSNRLERHHPAFPHFHLEMLGVEPECQGQGLGSAMLDSIAATLDADGLPCTLETGGQRNVELYQRFGFEVVGEEEILGVPMWFMLRRAAGGTSGVDG